MTRPDKSVLVEGYALDVVQVVEAVVLFLAVVVIALDLDKQIQFNFYLFVDLTKRFSY